MRLPARPLVSYRINRQLSVWKRDNDGAYGHVFKSRVRAMGIRFSPLVLIFSTPMRRTPI